MRIDQEDFTDLIQCADAYILALRQVVYAGDPDVRKRAEERLNDLGSVWRELREDCYPGKDIPYVVVSR